MQLNNKKRQNAIFCLKPVNVYLRMLKGQKVRNGSFLTKDYPFAPMIPNAMQKEISKQWDIIQKQILSTMPIVITLKKGEYDIKQD